MDYNDIVNSLIDGTNFELSNESQVLTSCTLKVRTPIEALNGLLGGGLPLNGVYHTWGAPKAGKSTWLYQTMGMFQKQYPEGICIIIDMESSADANRLKALGLDPSKVLRLPATSIESGFLALFKILENKKKNKQIKDIPIFIIWDTISRGLAQDTSSQSRMNAQDRARIIKNYMPDLESRIEDQPFFLGLINQVIYEADRYGNQHAKAGGGVALQHENHMSVCVSYVSEESDSTGSFVTAKWSKIDIDKSKISPEIRNIPFKIDTTKGGYIDERESFMWFMVNTLGYMKDAGMKWYTFDPVLEAYDGTPIADYIRTNYNKKFKYKNLVDLFNDDELLYNIFKFIYTDYISKTFSLQANIIKDYHDELYNSIMSILDPVDDSTSEEVQSNE